MLSATCEKPSILTAYSQQTFARLVSRKAAGETDESEKQAMREERMGEAFAGSEHLTVIGRCLLPGEIAPDFCLQYLDLVDLAVHTVRLTDLAGMVILFSMVNSLERPVCQVVTQRWEALREALPPDACIYTISMDTPEVQAGFQDRMGVLHQALSAHGSVLFGQDYGVWLKEWGLLQRSAVVIDRSDHIVYVEYVADQLSEPNYAAAIQGVQRAAGEW
jgi:thiol peroxidase